MIYLGKSYEEEWNVKHATIGELHGDELQKELNYWLASLIDYVNSHKAFNEQGLALLINGGWGAGKSAAARALVNGLMASTNPMPTVVHKAFLPFGGADDSITVFLGGLGDTLHKEGVLDIRKQIPHLISEVTPAGIDSLTLKGRVGPLELTRPLTMGGRYDTDDVLCKKFASLARTKKYIVLILDDLDRLKPGEIIAVMRMVEKLRKLPRVIVIVPADKGTIDRAIEQELGLSNSAAYLRKLIDGSVNLHTAYFTLSRVFLNELEADKTRFEAKLNGYPFEFPELVWSALVHLIAITELSNLLRRDDLASEQSWRIVERSEYFPRLYHVVNSSGNMGQEPYPVLDDSRGQRQIVPLDLSWTRLISPDHSPTPKDLSRKILVLQRADTVFRATFTDSDTINATRNAQRGSFLQYEDTQQYETKSLFQQLIWPLTNQLQYEPLVTENYSIRDIKNLAKDIMGSYRLEDMESLHGDEFLKAVYKVVQAVYGDFKPYRAD